jgi:tetratricopeptide (TPR) repeat protein
MKTAALLSLLCLVHVAGAQTVHAPDTAERMRPWTPGDSIARVAQAKAFFEKGNAWMAKGQRDSARLAYESAVDLDHHNVDAIVALAHLLVEDGYTSNARVLLNLAIRSNPGDPRLLHFKAIRDSASVRYDSLMNQPDVTEETYRAAASQALATGLYPRASDIVVRGLAQYPHSAPLRALADSARKMGDRQQ